MTTNTATWEELRKCNQLTPEQADDIFFPGNGKVGSRGAPKKAERFCAGCPVRRECLTLAITNGYDGNWAATSLKERRQMANVMHLFVKPVEDVMPDEPKHEDANGKRVAKYLHVKKTNSLHASWMDNAVSPFD